MSNTNGIILETGSPGSFARELNRVVKQHRNVNRPFVMIVVEQDGNATVLSNMGVEQERLKLLEKTIMGLLGKA